MKTEYTTKEDWIFLRKALWEAVSSTDNIIFCPPIMEGLEQFRYLRIEFREKCFECLEEEDPNKLLVNKIKEKIDKSKFVDL